MAKKDDNKGKGKSKGRESSESRGKVLHFTGELIPPPGMPIFDNNEIGERFYEVSMRLHVDLTEKLIDFICKKVWDNVRAREKVELKDNPIKLSLFDNIGFDLKKKEVYVPLHYTYIAGKAFNSYEDVKQTVQSDMYNIIIQYLEGFGTDYLPYEVKVVERDKKWAMDHYDHDVSDEYDDEPCCPCCGSHDVECIGEVEMPEPEIVNKALTYAVQGLSKLDQARRMLIDEDGCSLTKYNDLIKEAENDLMYAVDGVRAMHVDIN